MEPYWIPKHEVSARIVLDDGRTLDGAIYTDAVLGADALSEVLRRLNDSVEDFLPLRVAEDRFLLNRRGVLTVTFPCVLSPDEEARGRFVTVRVTLAGGTSLLGRVSIVMPPERSRVLDYLNAAPRFLPLFGEGMVTLVQRAFIVTVRGDGN